MRNKNTDMNIKSEMRDILICFAVKYKGNFQKIYDALKRKEKVTLDDIHKNKSVIDLGVITIIDSNYPAELKLAPYPPICLFAAGDIELADSEEIVLKTEGIARYDILTDVGLNRDFRICFIGEDALMVSQFYKSYINTLSIENRQTTKIKMNIINSRILSSHCKKIYADWSV